MLAVIGGSGLSSPGKKIEERRIETPHGNVSLQVLSILDEKVFFIPRHGESNTLPPHKINYKANVAALKKAGATGVISVYSAGIISKYKPGDFILVEDFIGLWSPITFYDNFSLGIRHTDMSNPFSREMQEKLEEVGAVTMVKINKGGIIATTPGPRYETKSEVAMLKNAGANLVNMTASYELSLLKEVEIDTVAIAVGTNYASGIGKKPIRYSETAKVMKEAQGKITSLVGGFAQEIV